MESSKESLCLKNEITLFREKLDSLLADHNSSPVEILELSQKLDNLIVKYYNIKNTRKSFS